jgi:DNA modification methylase
MMGVTARVLVGDVRDRLAGVEAGSVQTCVTSPPYWGLRDYGTSTWEGGSAECDHLGKPMSTRANVNAHTGGRDVKNAEYREPMKSTCTKCGAIRQDNQIGLEGSPEEFVESLCLVFDEVWRVLADDGTLWLNLGDSYNSSASNQNGTGNTTVTGGRHDRGGERRKGLLTDALPVKSLVGIPWRVAFALQARGWVLRSEIIWHKPNPMPESVTDRPTKSHEHIFLLAKSAKYFYDHEAIKEPVADQTKQRLAQDVENQVGSLRGNGGSKTNGNMKAVGSAESRNKRDVWTVPTKGYDGAHFAVYPTALIEPCILAGSREGDTVLDPFSGSGTTGVVALRNGRNYLGCELNPEYAELSRKRISDDCGMFGEVTVYE